MFTHGKNKTPVREAILHCAAIKTGQFAHMRAFQNLDDLARHERIIFTHRNCGVAWRYASGEVEARGALRLSHTEAMRDAALAGGGLAQLGAFLVGEDIREGRLIPVLQDHTRDEPPITAVYPTRRHVSPKVRKFASMIRDAWAGGPPWQ